jgi:hypothetical protein
MLECSGQRQMQRAPVTLAVAASKDALGRRCLHVQAAFRSSAVPLTSAVDRVYLPC